MAVKWRAPGATRPVGEEQGLLELALMWAVTSGLRPMLHLGKVDEALQLTALFPLPEVRAICLGHLGRDAEVKEILEQQVVERPGIGAGEDIFPVHMDIALLEAAVLVGHREAAELLLRKYSNWDMQATGFAGHVTCVPRHLGAAAALLDRPDEARAH